MGIQIGPFVIRVHNLRNELETGLRAAYRFRFPHDRFAGMELKDRLAAVASDCLYVAPTRMMLLSGKIDGEGQRIEFAVLTGNPAGITSSKLAFLVLANYDGQTNVVVKVEDIQASKTNDLPPNRPKPPLPAAPMPSDVTAAQLKIETVVLPPPAEVPAGSPWEVFSGIVTDRRSMAITADCFAGKPPKQVMMLVGKLGAEQETIGLALATADAELIKRNKCADVILAQRGEENNVSVKLEKIRVTSVIDLNETGAPIAAGETTTPAGPALPVPPETVEAAVAPLPETPATPPVPEPASQPLPPEPKTADAARGPRPVIMRSKRRAVPQKEDAIDQMMRKPRKLVRRSEVRTDHDYGLLTHVYKTVIVGHPERAWNFDLLIEQQPGLLPRFRGGDPPTTQELEGIMGKLFNWPETPKRSKRSR